MIKVITLNLEESTYDQTKSGIKVKQYLNNDIPVLSTDLPENNNYLLNGINSFLCKSAYDFHQRIKEFHDMKEEDYLQFSRKALKSVDQFNHEKYLADLHNLINIDS